MRLGHVGLQHAQLFTCTWRQSDAPTSVCIILPLIHWHAARSIGADDGSNARVLGELLNEMGSEAPSGTGDDDDGGGAARDGGSSLISSGIELGPRVYVATKSSASSSLALILPGLFSCAVPVING